MSRYLAVTTCNAQMWKQYGGAMVATYCQNWPFEVPLRFYTESFEPEFPVAPDRGPHPPIIMMDLAYSVPWLPMFKQLYSDPKSRGMVNGKYDYHWDAVKFAHKVAAIGAAGEDDNYDCSSMVDADVITFAPVTVERLERMLPSSATIAMIEREKKYPECGFMMFRLPAARKVIRQIVAMYRTGAIFDLPETHDSFVIGHVVKKAVAKGDAVVHPLAPLDLPKKHPFVNSPLGDVMDHLKGGRKVQGKSHRTDLVQPRSEPYWR